MWAKPRRFCYARQAMADEAQELAALTAVISESIRTGQRMRAVEAFEKLQRLTQESKRFTIDRVDVRRMLGSLLERSMTAAQARPIPSDVLSIGPGPIAATAEPVPEPSKRPGWARPPAVHFVQLGDRHLLQHAILADHDFIIELALRSPAGPTGGHDPLALIGGFEAGTWLVGLDRHGRVGLWLGDGQSWTVCDARVGATPVRDGDWHRILFARRGPAISIRVDDIPEIVLTVPDGLRLRGNAAELGAFSGVANPVGMELRLLGFDVKPYDPPGSWGDEPVDIFCACYGPEYTRLLEKVMLPSLVQPGNQPTRRPLRCFLYCLPSDVPNFAGFTALAAQHGIAVHTQTAFMDAANPRMSIYRAIVDQLERSNRERSIVLVAAPDHIFGTGLGRLIDDLQPYEYMVCGHPRISMEKAARPLERFVQTPFTNGDLVRICLEEFPHPLVQHGLTHDEPYWRALRKDGDYFAYSKEPPPICFSSTPDLLNIVEGLNLFGNFETIDHDIVDYCYRTDRLKFVSDSDTFFWAELVSESRYAPTIQNDYWSAAATMFHGQPLHWKPSRQS